MLLLIAWRNIWRNRIRSLVVIFSISIGLWAGIFVMAFSWGMYQGHIKEVIRYQLSHIQIHHPGFLSEKEMADTIANDNAIVAMINGQSHVKAVVKRSKGFGIILSPTNSFGVGISGIDPESESKITDLGSMVIKGAYLDSGAANSIIVGKKLAGKLNVEVSDKVVIMLQDADGELVSGAFRVKGIFRTHNSTFDEANIFITRKGFNKLLGADHITHEIAVLLDGEDALPSFQMKLEKAFPGLDIRNWRQLSPELDLVISSFNQYMYIFIGIILLALMFGIVNTMLMAVLERQRELGMLMAIGMNKSRVFFMIMLETLMLAIVGGPFGILLSHITIVWLGHQGINLSMFSEGLSVYGFSTIIYPAINPDRYLPVMFMTMGVAMISAIYPAYKALTLKPAKAIRKI